MPPVVRTVGFALFGLVFTISALLSVAGCEKKADPAQGRALFASTCARCHGLEGRGGAPLFDGGPSPRNFHDHDFQRGRTDLQLKQIIANGKGVGMPQFGTTFDDTQLGSLVAQVRSFDDQAGATK